MELRHLRYFIAVAEDMNMHRAAARLNISQPPLSLSIKQLEQELGIDLFTRNGRGIQITRAGETYLLHAREILAATSAAAEQARQLHAGIVGVLRIGFISSAVSGILQDSVSAYRIRYPGVKLQIEQVTNATIPHLVETGKFDIGILRLPEPIPTNLTLTQLTRESWHVALLETHELAQRDSVSIKDLDGQPLIFYPRWNTPAGYDDVIRLFREKNVEPQIFQEAPEQMTIAGLVASGMGIGIVPECMARIKIPGVTHRPIKGTKNRTGFAIVTRTQNDRLVENFINLAKA